MKASLIIVLLLGPTCVLGLFQMKDLPQSVMDIAASRAASPSSRAAYPFQNPANCQQARFQGCQNAFNQYLGIPTNADWRDPDILAQEMVKRYMQGPDGLNQVCRASQLLYSCLGPTYYSCFNPLYLIGQNIPIDNSFGFSAEILRNFFRCTGGLEQSINQWTCIGQVYNTSGPAIAQCVNAFNNTVNADPNNLCAASQAFMNCFSQPYAACGTTVQWWACEDIRVGFSLFVCDNLRCDVNSATVRESMSSDPNVHAIQANDKLFGVQ